MHLKQAKDMKKYFTEDDVQMVNKDPKKMLNIINL